ncbi:hypothetical protein [Haloferula helveola]|uniref:hypothetical protein n=1 Tax=Haloferula helveola TaxID=490095 RepID=UPI0033402579
MSKTLTAGSAWGLLAHQWLRILAAPSHLGNLESLTCLGHLVVVERLEHVRKL